MKRMFIVSRDEGGCWNVPVRLKRLLAVGRKDDLVVCRHEDSNKYILSKAVIAPETVPGTKVSKFLIDEHLRIKLPEEIEEQLAWKNVIFAYYEDNYAILTHGRPYCDICQEIDIKEGYHDMDHPVHDLGHLHLCDQCFKGVKAAKEKAKTPENEIYDDIDDFADTESPFDSLPLDLELVSDLLRQNADSALMANTLQQLEDFALALEESHHVSGLMLGRRG